MTYRALRFAAVATVFGAAGYLSAFIANGAAGPVRVKLEARKFDFSATEIRVKKGQPVTLVLSGNDFVHGFSVPDFNVRADIIPGKTVEVTFTPGRTGRFHFLCDNFCGEGHDRMAGFLVVTDD